MSYCPLHLRTEVLTVSLKRKSKKQSKPKRVRSGLEARVRADLDERNIEYGYETIKLKYTKLVCKNCGCNVQNGTYIPDFIIPRSKGRTLIVECKGYFDSSARSKMERVFRDNPEEDIRFLFQRNNSIRKGSSTKYSDWCDRRGYKYHIGETIPDEWIKD